ncbi:hypothetical protein HDU78_001197, partial [Chytriomyces hyalinus]
PPVQQRKDTQTAAHVVANIRDDDDERRSLTQPDSNLSDGYVSVLDGGKDATITTTTTIASLPSNAAKVSLFDAMHTVTIPHIETYPNTTPDYKKQDRETPNQLIARDLQIVHPTKWTVNDVGVWCAAQLPDLAVQINARVVDRDINGSRLVAMRRNDFSEQLGLVFADAVVLEDAVDAVVQRHLNLSLPSYEQSG